MVRVAINGLGAMGRYFLRALQINENEYESNGIEVVAFNDIFTAEQIAPLIAHDSIYREFPSNMGSKSKVDVSENSLWINDHEIVGFCERDPSKLPWDKFYVDVVYDATGFFAKNGGLEKHLEAGAKKVVVSAPSKFAEVTIVMGVNEEAYTGQDIISAASCTTNCLAPLVSVLHREYGIHEGMMTTIHAYTQDQNLTDGPHKDVARGYAAGLNFVPTKTGAAKAIGLVLPELAGKIDGMAMRGPVAVGSVVDLNVYLDNFVTPPEINDMMRETTQRDMKGCILYQDGPVVSSMSIGRSEPCIFDASQTMMVGSSKSMLKVIVHYDNVAGYSHQAVKLVQHVGQRL